MDIPSFQTFLEYIRTQAGLGVALAFFLEWAQRQWPTSALLTTYMVFTAFAIAVTISVIALAVQIALGTGTWTVEAVWSSVATAFIVCQTAYAIGHGIAKARSG